jgi:hypothetical protein
MALEELDGSEGTPEAKKTVTDTGISAEQYAEQKKKIEELQKQLGSLIELQSVPNQGVQNTDLGSADAITQVINAINKKSDEEKYGTDGRNYLSQDDVDPEDRLEKGVEFFCHSGGYLIVDDMRDGRPVATPFRNVLFFTTFKTTKTGSGRDTKTETVSRYVSFSKKEVEWLRESSFYGWKIFDDIKIATSAHAKLAELIQKNLSSAKAMLTGTLITECKALGISQSVDLVNMRLLYATAKAEEMLKIQEDKALLRSRNAEIEGQLVKETAELVK